MPLNAAGSPIMSYLLLTFSCRPEVPFSGHSGLHPLVFMHPDTLPRRLTKQHVRRRQQHHVHQQRDIRGEAEEAVTGGHEDEHEDQAEHRRDLAGIWTDFRIWWSSRWSRDADRSNQRGDETRPWYNPDIS